MLNIEQVPEQETELESLANSLIQALQAENQQLCCIESCTGGLIAAHITSIAGSSQVFKSGFITYSNEAKHNMVGVNLNTIRTYSVTSEQVAIEMLKGGLLESSADIGISVTGIAGPDGGTIEQPVGTVCFAWGNKNRVVSSTKKFDGNRSEIRNLAVSYAFGQLLAFIK